MTSRSPKKTMSSRAVTKGVGFVNTGLATISGRLFPETRQLTEADDDGEVEEFQLTNTTIASSLPLQMLLYFNVHYSLFWSILELALMIFRENYLEINGAYKVLSPLLLSVWMVVEPLRLYFGYVGNLQEKVPQLTGFWLFTLLPQLPICFFFILSTPISITTASAAGSIQLPFDRAGSIFLLIMTALGGILGYIALRTMVKSQVLKFHLQRSREVYEGAAAVGTQNNRV